MIVMPMRIHWILTASYALQPQRKTAEQVHALELKPAARKASGETAQRRMLTAEPAANVRTTIILFRLLI
jgi:hypothetical protein